MWIAELERPGVHRDLNRSIGAGRAAQLAAAREPHDRSGRRRCCDRIEDVGAGERGHHCGDRPAPQLAGGAELHNPAAVDHGDPIGHGRRVIERVRHQQSRQPKSREDLGELIADLPAGDCVECAEWLVEQQYARLARQCAGERHSLALPT